MKHPSENIINELKSISPRLASLDRSNAFRVPAEYFSKLTQQVIAQLSSSKDAAWTGISSNETSDSTLAIPPGYFESLQEKVLKKIADEELGNLPEYITTTRKENPFIAPAGYFDQLTDTVILKQQQDDSNRTRIFKLFNTKFALIAAACVGIVLTVFLLQEPKQPISLAKINSDDVIEYMTDNLEDFDEYELMPLVNEEQLNEFESINLLDEDIQEYLYEEDIEYELNEIL